MAIAHSPAAEAKFSAHERYLTWWPVLVGLAALYIPTYVDLARSVWNTEEQGHGALVLAAVLWMFWRQREFLVIDVRRAWRVSGSLVLAFGLLLYAIGRSQQILILEVGSQIPVFAGTVLLLCGPLALRAIWFPLFFLIFMVPLPGFVVDELTGALKQKVSHVAGRLLYELGYPIAWQGTILTIGPYQLLVADACSGLNSMFSLSAMGLLYLYFMNHRSWLRNALLLACVIPIAFAANIVRVIFLVLVTYYLGDTAGQGMVHDLASVVMFVAALLFLFLIDAVLGLVLRGRGRGAAS